MRSQVVPRASSRCGHYSGRRRRQPASSQRLEQQQHRVEAGGTVLDQDILGGEKRLLSLQKRDEVDRSFLQLLIAQVEGALRGRNRFPLEPFGFGSIGYRDERPLDIGKAGDDCFAIIVEKFVLPALRILE